MGLWKPYMGLMRSLNKIGCSHALDFYCQGLLSQKGQFQYDLEFAESQPLGGLETGTSHHFLQERTLGNMLGVNISMKISSGVVPSFLWLLLLCMNSSYSFANRTNLLHPILIFFSRTILDQYLKHAVELTEQSNSRDQKSLSRQCQTYFHLARYTDGLFKSYEERLASSGWQATLPLRKHKTRELDALIRVLRSSTKGEKVDCSIKIQELQKQLTMFREETEKLQDDGDKFMSLALEAYQQCLVIGGKYDLRVALTFGEDIIYSPDGLLGSGLVGLQ
ncbi:putative non-specific serine/threonine protein kinase [Dioscorea sansibarensis]